MAKAGSLEASKSVQQDLGTACHRELSPKPVVTDPCGHLLQILSLAAVEKTDF
jgi:hypothetical protein